MQMPVCLVFAVALAVGGASGPIQNADSWAPYRFLIGEWTGQEKGQPGATTGTATFRTDLGGRVLVRTSRTMVPAKGTQTGYVHDDLLILYREAPGQPVKAIYFDNEDHTIAYDVSASPDGKVISFVSSPVPSATRFRLVYTKISDDVVDVRFQIAPPGSPEAFKTYLEGRMTRMRGDGKR